MRDARLGVASGLRVCGGMMGIENVSVGLHAWPNILFAQRYVVYYFHIAGYFRFLPTVLNQPVSTPNFILS